jgi:hypothetical protein
MQSARRALLVTTALWAVGARANLAVPAEVAAGLPGARVQGSAWMRFLGLRVYEARLWTGPTAVPQDWATAPLALEIEYARSLKGAAIAERSLVEMRRQGEIEATTAQRWLAAMKQLFPDVGAGDRLTALNRPGVGLQFFANGQLRGAVDEPDFAQRFLGIWLARQTSEPVLRAALLGGGEAR